MINLIKKYLGGYTFAIIIASAFILTLLGYSQFSHSEAFVEFTEWSRQNIFLLILILFFIKLIGIVWPPLPGIVFMIGAIPLIGWLPVFLIDFSGAILGSVIVFNISRKYGPKVVLKLFGKSGLAQVQKFKFNPQKEFEAVLIMRFFMGSISELISYGAGLTNIKFKNYFWGTVLSYLIIGIPLFYMLGLVLDGGNLLFSAVPLGLGLLIMFVLRKRYFIWDD